MPGMDEEPASTFQNLSMLMDKIGLSSSEDQQDGEDDVEVEEPQKPKVSSRAGEREYLRGRKEEVEVEIPKKTKISWRDTDSDRLKSNLEKTEENTSLRGTTWREERSKQTPEIGTL